MNDVPVEFRVSVFEIAVRLGIQPRDLTTPHHGLYKAGLLPPITHPAGRGGAFCYDVRVVGPWIEQNREAVQATVNASKSRARRSGGQERVQANHPVETAIASSRPPQPSHHKHHQDAFVDIVADAGKVLTHGELVARRRLSSTRQSLPVASSNFIAPITREKLMAGR